VEFVLVRHGQPEWVRDGLNVDDPPLTELGHLQAQAMAVSLASETFTEVACSPMVRSRQTASPLYRALGRDEVIDPWLEEIRNPIWGGSPAEKSEEAFHEEWNRPLHDRWRGLEHIGGERVDAFVERIHRDFSRFLQDRGVSRVEAKLPVWKIADPEQRIAFIAHAGTNSVVICHLLGLDPTPWEWERFVINHGSVSRVEALKMGDYYTFSLTRLSDVEYLTPEQRTR
jgi:2,3-bisphosphoglycerate-dependent phosphoglycerate mutase